MQRFIRFGPSDVHSGSSALAAQQTQRLNRFPAQRLRQRPTRFEVIPQKAPHVITVHVFQRPIGMVPAAYPL